jgi:hypothetical protein
MQTITRAILTAGLFACVVISAMQAMAKPSKGGSCAVVNGTCVSLGCSECGPAFPARCTCLR